MFNVVVTGNQVGADDRLDVELAKAPRCGHGRRLTDEMQRLGLIIREGAVTPSGTVDPTLSTDFFQAPHDIIRLGHSPQYFLDG